MRPIAFERVSLADAKRAHDGPPARNWREDWAGRRAVANDPQALDAGEIGNPAVHYASLHPPGRGWTAAR